MLIRSYQVTLVLDECHHSVAVWPVGQAFSGLVLVLGLLEMELDLPQVVCHYTCGHLGLWEEVKVLRSLTCCVPKEGNLSERHSLCIVLWMQGIMKSHCVGKMFNLAHVPMYSMSETHAACGFHAPRGWSGQYRSPQKTILHLSLLTRLHLLSLHLKTSMRGTTQSVEDSDSIWKQWFYVMRTQISSLKALS